MISFINRENWLRLNSTTPVSQGFQLIHIRRNLRSVNEYMEQ